MKRSNDYDLAIDKLLKKQKKNTECSLSKRKK